MGFEDESTALDNEYCLLKDVGKRLNKCELEEILFLLEGPKGRVKLCAADVEEISDFKVPWIALMRHLLKCFPDMPTLIHFLEKLLHEIGRIDLAVSLRMRKDFVKEHLSVCFELL